MHSCSGSCLLLAVKVVVHGLWSEGGEQVPEGRRGSDASEMKVVRETASVLSVSKVVVVRGGGWALRKGGAVLTQI